jgi:peptidoglycan/LPS O-acetylase OafA/YrhL
LGGDAALKPRAKGGSLTTARDAGIDRIRVALTILVILHHTAIAYGGSGGWYWREEPNGSNVLLVIFNAINQSYFMGAFFLLAGYYTPASYDRKGAWRFLQERLLRLGLPLLFFSFLLHPLTLALAQSADMASLWPNWRHMMATHAFAPGPLWFAEALLIFALAYIAWRAVSGGRSDTRLSLRDLPRARVMAAAAVLLGLIAFAVRLLIPVGHEVLWLQLGYFPSYVFLFAVGCAAARAKLLGRITLKAAGPWMVVAALALATLPIVLVTRGDAGGFDGGWNLNALYYALWDPFMAWGVILFLLWAARQWWRAATPFTVWLSRGAFGAYVIHPPVVVALSLAAASWHAPALAKFAGVGAAASIGSFVLAAGLRSIPGIRRII